jgi:hypothetical protein
LLEGFTDAASLADDFIAADCHALYRAVGQRLLDVEADGLAAVDALLAWFVTRARYGLAHLPGGSPQRFLRARALVRPERGHVVLVRAVESDRAWLRRLEATLGDQVIDIWSGPCCSDSSELALLAVDLGVVGH